MDELCTHIKALFLGLQPEIVLQNLRSGSRSDAESGILYVNARKISKEGYLHCIRAMHLNRSEDELYQLYWNLDDRLNADPNVNIFSLLARYGEQVLQLHNGEPLCRQETIISWRMTTHDIGQNLVTCSFLASEDARNQHESIYFEWPSVVRTNNLLLQSILKRGLAENHFHLNGSTQVFPLTWGFLMNHPDKAERFFDNNHFSENLKLTVSQGVRDNKLPWKTRIYYAAWIRAHLFHILQRGRCGGGTLIERDFAEFDRKSLDKQGTVTRIAEELRYMSGAKFLQLNGTRICLDYAITPKIFRNNSGAFRYLAGERGFLYNCFKCCFNGKFSFFEQDLFLLYLLIQVQFRGELVQSNLRTGFFNFAAYQDRKTDGWGEDAAYFSESRRLAINGTMCENVNSLEMRIMPSSSARQLKKKIEIDDKLVMLASERKSDEKIKSDASKTKRETSQDCFFVLHFAKRRQERIEKGQHLSFLPPRNNNVRILIKKQAKAIVNAIERYPKLSSRIRGIDGCSYEIGCRPETFATEFRYLRGFEPRDIQYMHGGRLRPTLGATFHAGEDFLDIVDGIRAIDEAILFLDLHRGDRIGHALALGVEPKLHYKYKGHKVYIPKQDLLDNYMWILFRSEQWGLSISAELRSRLLVQTEAMLQDIYKCTDYGALRDYSFSWLLRGDSPTLYEKPYMDSNQMRRLLKMSRENVIEYERFAASSRYGIGFELDSLRCNPNVYRFVHMYHFDYDARINGQTVVCMDVDDSYLLLVRDIQDSMIEQLMEKGISVECNPSSNYLIGTFGEYANHPIFRFNHYGLDKAASSSQLAVSVNTDDQGVFDTSLENEFALMAGALSSKRHKNGRRLYSDDEVMEYIDHLRKMGIDMTFPPS